uniref:Uncharacterized protein n=1 Tax=Meloidogyne hapla TaxID=6305 RepID=A0A1I8BPE4_MELHA
MLIPLNGKLLRQRKHLWKFLDRIKTSVRCRSQWCVSDSFRRLLMDLRFVGYAEAEILEIEGSLEKNRKHTTGNDNEQTFLYDPETSTDACVAATTCHSTELTLDKKFRKKYNLMN